MPVIENDVSRLSDTLRFFYEIVALLPIMEQLPELFECIYEKASIGCILLKLLVSYGKLFRILAL